MEKSMGKRKHKLSVFMLIDLIITILALSIIIMLIGYVVFTNVVQEQYNNSAYEIAETAKTYLDADKLEGYLETGETDEEYDEVLEKLDNLTVSANCNFIYVGSIDTNDYITTTYIFDSVNPSTGYDRYDLGYTATDGDPNYVDDMKLILETGGRAEHYLFSKTESGPHITAGLGVTDSEGKVVAVIGVEKSITTLFVARNTYVFNVVLFTFIFLLIVIGINWMFLRKSMIHPIEEITKEAERFALEQNALDELQAEHRPTEIGTLACAIKSMEQNINVYVENLTKVTAEKERISAELYLATKIQSDMLPSIFPNFANREEYTIYATMNPAKEVGGDFYDFFYIDNDHLGLVMADVSGKGVPSALFMVIAKTLIKTRAQMGGKPSEILRTVNNQLCEGNDACFFVTVWLGILDIRTGKVIESNAGHECPAVKRADGSFELRETPHDTALAVIDGLEYADYEFELHKGDRLFIYTDGVTEATNKDQKMFGEKKMLESLSKNAGLPLEDMLKSLKLDIDAFVGDAPQFDDITMLGFELK